MSLPGCPTGQEGARPPNLPNAQDLLRVLLTVGRGGDDKQPVQQVNGDAMGALVAGTPDPGEDGRKGCQVMFPEPSSLFLLLKILLPTCPSQPTLGTKYQ